MNYYVLQIADFSRYGKQSRGADVLDFLVNEKSAWGVGPNCPNRKAVQAGDKVLFYLSGSRKQTFVGVATLKSGAYKDRTGKSNDWFLDPDTLCIDLKNIFIFKKPVFRKEIKTIKWKPSRSGISRISKSDYDVIFNACTR